MPSLDDEFSQPYTDVDEQREHPVPHRYIHGGFTGTDTRFSVYFPPADFYEDRFFQHVTPVPQSALLGARDDGPHSKVRFAHASGAYFVETNGGGPRAADPTSGMDPTIGAYRANAAAAEYSRDLARRVYERPEHRPYGYLYGGSGGGYRTIGAAENTEGVWDGFLPFVIGSPMAMPNVFTVRMHAQRVLRDVFDQVVDAFDAGGDPSALAEHLTVEQQHALEEATAMGFPPRSWFGWRTMGMHAFNALYQGVLAIDPTYASDFWTVPGYEGADPNSSVHRDRVQLTTTVTEIVADGSEADAVSGTVDDSYKAMVGEALPVGVRLADRPTGWLLGAELHTPAGPLQVHEVTGDEVWIEPGPASEAARGLAPGTEVTLDNSNFLAVQTYHRHQVPPEGYPVWDRFRDADGAPLYPQRPMLVGPILTAGASGTVPSGRIADKMIVLACLLDREAYAWQADWYRTQVRAHLGEEAAEDGFRLWYMDNALHGDDGEQEFPTRSIEYLGALEVGLRQLAAWVEDGVEPSEESRYEVEGGQVRLESGATDATAGGVQPVCRLATGASGVRRGEEVQVTLTAESPSPGVFCEVSWDLEGTGELGAAEPVEAAGTLRLQRTVHFDEAGTYVVAARVVAQAEGHAADPFGRVHNIARARVGVEA